MKKFEFSLQALLNVNIAFEKEQKNALSIVNNELNGLNAEREILIYEIKNNSNAYVILIEGMININHIRNRNKYLKHLNEELKALEEIISKKEKEKEELLAVVVETMTKIKSLENLKRKQYKQYLADVTKENEVTIEDFASYNYIQSDQWGAKFEKINY